MNRRTLRIVIVAGVFLLVAVGVVLVLPAPKRHVFLELTGTLAPEP